MNNLSVSEKRAIQKKLLLLLCDEFKVFVSNAVDHGLADRHHDGLEFLEIAFAHFRLVDESGKKPLVESELLK